MKYLVRPLLFASMLFCGTTSLWALDIGEVLQRGTPREAPVQPAVTQVAPGLPEPLQAPQVQTPQKSTPGKLPEESIQETKETRREIAKDFVRVEKFQKGIGRSVELSVACPPNMAAISGGGHNAGEPVFHVKESHPDQQNGWRIVFNRDPAPWTFKIVGANDPQPPAPYQITLFVTCVDISR